MKNIKAVMVQQGIMDQVDISECQAIKLDQHTSLHIITMVEARLVRLLRLKQGGNLHKFIVRATWKEIDKWPIVQINIQESLNDMDQKGSSIRQR